MTGKKWKAAGLLLIIALIAAAVLLATAILLTPPQSYRGTFVINAEGRHAHGNLC